MKGRGGWNGGLKRLEDDVNVVVLRDGTLYVQRATCSVLTCNAGNLLVGDWCLVYSQ